MAGKEILPEGNKGTLPIIFSSISRFRVQPRQVIMYYYNRLHVNHNYTNSIKLPPMTRLAVSLTYSASLL